jgi:hypothetical protein
LSEDGKTRGVCTACDEHTKPDSRCFDEFTCSTCGHTLNKCISLPGGLDATGTECNNCQGKRRLDEMRELAKLVKRFKSE